MKLNSLLVFSAVILLAGCGGREAAPDETGADAPRAGAPAPVGEIAGDTAVRDGAAIAADDVDGAAPPLVPPATPRPAPGAGAPVVDGPAAAAPAPTPAPADDGAAILRRAAAAYENVRSLQADFVMNFENPLLRQRLTSRGTLYQRQPDRIALRFTDPAGDMIIGDGQYFYLYYPSNNPDQYIRQAAAAAGETGVNLQAQFVGNPVERFNYTLEGSESVGGRAARVLTLVPRQRAEYRSLKVWIDDRDSLARRFEITEHNGSVRRFDLQNMQVNPSLSDAVFRFTPPPGARAITAG
jgi:outer membrane lipoprotein carrier protein